MYKKLKIQNIFIRCYYLFPFSEMNIFLSHIEFFLNIDKYAHFEVIFKKEYLTFNFIKKHFLNKKIVKRIKNNKKTKNKYLKN
jgi:hypothetical protein